MGLYGNFSYLDLLALATVVSIKNRKPSGLRLDQAGLDIVSLTIVTVLNLISDKIDLANYYQYAAANFGCFS